MKRKAIPEVKIYFSQVKIELDNSAIYFSYTEREPISIMNDFFDEIFIAIDGLHKDGNFTIFVMENLLESNFDENQKFVIENLVESNFDNNQNFHLPNNVFSYIKPTVPTQSILHVLLAMGRFETEIDLMQHSSLREGFKYAKLIGLFKNSKKDR